MAQSTATPITGAAWTALVFTHEQSFFAGRTMRTSTSYVPPGLLADPGWLLDQVAALFDAAGAGTVVVPAVPGPYHTPDWVNLPYPDQLRACARMAAQRGWSTTDTALSGEYGWMTWTKRGAATVHMGILPHIKDSDDQLVSMEDPPEVQADLLARYHASVGVPWISHPGVAGVNLARTLYERTVRTRGGGERARAQPMWIERLDEQLVGAGDIMWSRRRHSLEMTRDVIAQWDLRMAYGAAAGVAELPVDRLRESTGPTGWDPAVAGFWLIRIPEGAWWARNGEIGPPLLNPARVRADGTAWLTTPLLDVLFTDLRVRPEILDSRTTTHTDRVLREWYERLRDARVMNPNGDNPRLSAAIKSTANSAIGMMGSGRGRIQRRAWQHTIIDQSRANLFRKLHKACATIGWPFRIEHDSVWFALRDSDEDRARHSQALGVHPAMGRFRFVREWERVKYERDREYEIARRRDRMATR